MRKDRYNSKCAKTNLCREKCDDSLENCKRELQIESYN